MKNSKSSKEDILLVENFLTGNKEKAFRDIYDKYYGKIRMKLLIQSRDEFLTDDLVSEAFMKVYNKLETFDPQKAVLYTWITKVATNHFIDHLRKEAKNSEMIDGNELSNGYKVFDESSNPEENINNEERTKVIDNVIKNALTKESVRNLVRLRYFDEFSYEEIADITGTPLGSIKNSLFRARNIMKEYLEKISSKEAMLY